MESVFAFCTERRLLWLARPMKVSLLAFVIVLLLLLRFLVSIHVPC